MAKEKIYSLVKDGDSIKLKESSGYIKNISGLEVGIFKDESGAWLAVLTNCGVWITFGNTKKEVESKLEKLISNIDTKIQTEKLEEYKKIYKKLREEIENGS